MNERIQKLIKDSGFILWEDEPWGPDRGHIDWASDYTKEMEVFVEKLVTACADHVRWSNCFTNSKQAEFAAKKLLHDFGVGKDD